MKTNTKRITHYIMALVSIVVLVLLDQITKHLVVLHLKDRSAYVLIKDVFQLEYLENRGAAFGVLQNQRIFFYISVLLITIAVLGSAESRSGFRENRACRGQKKRQS